MPSPSSVRSARLPLASLVFACAPLFAQNPITWAVADISSAATDVSTRGELCIAVNMGPEVCEAVVNGVHFQADRSHWTRKLLTRGATSTSSIMYFPAWTNGGFVLTTPYNRTAGGIGARHATESDYDAILRDGRHSSPGTTTVNCSIAGLTPGHTYEIQLFYGAASRPTRITEWDDGVGNGPGSGGIYLAASGPHSGQVATGTFVAAASGIQTFGNSQHPASGSIPETNNACSAMQIRDLTPTGSDPLVHYFGEGTPGTDTQPNLGGTRCSPGIGMIGAPRVGASVLLTVENSQDVPSPAILVVGPQSLSLPVLGGTLLVSPQFTAGILIQPPVSPYVHDHELQLPLTIPGGVGASVYFQVVQLDPGAAGGYSMTAALRVRIGV
ncbi:MAG: hypothetical protein KDC98_04155 [Planctomycetes bacterium]|nr:hypothetical protein [Planctomycetota bacterium]